MFNVICAGRHVQSDFQPISPTEIQTILPGAPSINHLVVFLSPIHTLSPGLAACVHIQLPNRPWLLLGAISPTKPSAIFKIREVGVDEGDAVLGISVQPEEVVEAQLEVLRQAGGGGAGAGKVVVASNDVKGLAQRIVGDCFNYLSGFATGSVGREVVELKAFQNWWQKFEKKLDVDPGFLERRNG